MINVTIINAIIDNRRLTSELVTRDNVKIYLGMYTFFSRLALPTIDRIEALVASDINPNRICPVNK